MGKSGPETKMLWVLLLAFFIKMYTLRLRENSELGDDSSLAFLVTRFIQLLKHDQNNGYSLLLYITLL